MAKTFVLLASQTQQNEWNKTALHSHMPTPSHVQCISITWFQTISIERHRNNGNKLSTQQEAWQLATQIKGKPRGRGWVRKSENERINTSATKRRSDSILFAQLAAICTIHTKPIVLLRFQFLTSLLQYRCTATTTLLSGYALCAMRYACASLFVCFKLFFKSHYSFVRSPERWAKLVSHLYVEHVAQHNE